MKIIEALSQSKRKKGKDERDAGAPSDALAIIAQYASALAAADYERMCALHAQDFTLDLVQRDAFEQQPLSRNENDLFWPSWFESFPEMDYQVLRTIASDKVVVTEWVFTGTNSGALTTPVFGRDIAPTGRTIRFRGVSIYDIESGHIQRETIYIDLGTILVELGVTL